MVTLLPDEAQRVVATTPLVIAPQSALTFDWSMRASIVLGVLAALLLGFFAGAWVYRDHGDGVGLDERGADATDRAAEVRDDSNDFVDESARERARRHDETDGQDERDEDRQDLDEGTSTNRARRVPWTNDQLERRQEELDARIAEARRERDELFGTPVPPSPNAPTRFLATSIATSLRGALEAEGVDGEIEGVDCSEHPCIAFGRLRGDEEDVEEVERSAALDAYRDDVLVLLLWATTARDGEPSTPESAMREAPAREAAMPAETAIFALAFLPPDGVTDAIERRIRARVFEVWNVERPGRDSLEPPAI